MILDDPAAAAPYHAARRARVMREIASRPFDALLVTSLVNTRYLSGFSGSSAAALLTAGGAWFLTDFRYLEQAAREAPGMALERVNDLAEGLGGLLARLEVRTLGFEAEHVSVAKLAKLRQGCPNVEFAPTEKIVETQRLIKDEAEIGTLRALVAMLETAMPAARELIRPGAVERDVAVELEYRLRALGGDGPAFDFIVASGARAALPHGVASSKAIEPGEVVTLDWGVKGWGYYTDTTRTFTVGAVEPRMQEVLRVVNEANLAALDAVRPGAELRAIDAAARDLIKAAGYGDQFGHGTGHGVGMVIHEEPRVSYTSTGVAEPGMVFTIEPGIYLPGIGGARVEDMALVTGHGLEILTRGLSKDPLWLAQ